MSSNRNILLLFISHGIIAILSFQIGLSFLNCNKCNNDNSISVHNDNNINNRKTSSFTQQQQQSIGYMNRYDFFHMFDMGIPLPSSSSSLDIEHRVLILYPELLSSLSQSTRNTTITTTNIDMLNSPIISNSRINTKKASDTITFDTITTKTPPPLTTTIETLDRINSNCDVVKLILTQHQSNNNNNNRSLLSTCYVIAEQHDSYHIHKFVPKQRQKNKKKVKTTAKIQEQQQRRHDIDTKSSSTTQWEKVSQFYKPDDYNDDNKNSKNKMLRIQKQQQSSLSNSMEFPPKPMITKLVFQYLQQYLQIQDEVLQQLQSLVVSSNISLTTTTSKSYPSYIVIMLCNWEQHELLLNFICQCNRLHISLHNYILFAMDDKIYQFAKQFNMNVYYHEHLFPSYNNNHNDNNNIEYGTIEYSYIMMAKVYVMHLMVSCLGYNVFFHDIDIIPLQSTYIANFLIQAKSSTSNHDNNNSNDHDNNDDIYDMYFQYEMNDDITISNNNNIKSYVPYLANTGFYYVHNTIRTKYFFSILIRSLDLIYRTKSHQAVMNILMNQHNSLFNLRIKTMSHINNDYPGKY